MARQASFAAELDRVMLSVGVRDYSRLRRDAMELVGTDLVEMQPVVSTEGGTVSLVGTLAIRYHGAQYNIPIEMSLPSYPDVPPICFVRPTADMMIRSNHKNVDATGRIGLDYLQHWSPQESTLVELCTFASSAFSSKPPLFAKPTQEQPPPSYEAMIDPRTAVADKLKDAIRDYYQKTRLEIDVEFRAQSHLQRAQQKTHAKTNPIEMRDRLVTQVEAVEATASELNRWLDQNEVPEPDLVPADPVSTQLLAKSCEIHAIEDVLFALDQFLAEGLIDLDHFLKDVRRIANLQFKLKAHVFKIYQAIADRQRASNRPSPA